MAKKMKPLTAAEKKWFAKLQKVLDECPSPERMNSYTIGDHYITIYDSSFDDDVKALVDRGNDEVCSAVEKLDCALFELKMPFAVDSTAG